MLPTLPLPGRRSQSHAPRRTFLVEPCDIGLHSTETGVSTLQAHFAAWLRGLNRPARFVCWLMPASLDDKIAALSWTAREVAQGDPVRRALLMEYRRHYETLQDAADYQRSMCGLALWSEEHPRALAKGMMTAFETFVGESRWPPLFQGRYRVKSAPFGHLAPVGRPGGRLLWAILSSRCCRSTSRWRCRWTCPPPTTAGRASKRSSRPSWPTTCT
jgi:hypothetical protein